MKIRLTKTSIKNIDEQIIINADLSSYIKVGSMFFIYGIRICKDNLIYAYIFHEHGHLIEVPLPLFEIIEDSVSNYWKFKIWGNGEVTLWPSLFYEDNFLENFAEREEKERLQFEELSIMMENEIQ